MPTTRLYTDIYGRAHCTHGRREPKKGQILTSFRLPYKENGASSSCLWLLRSNSMVRRNNSIITSLFSKFSYFVRLLGSATYNRPALTKTTLESPGLIICWFLRHQWGHAYDADLFRCAATSRAVVKISEEGTVHICGHQTLCWQYQKLSWLKQCGQQNDLFLEKGWGLRQNSPNEFCLFSHCDATERTSERDSVTWKGQWTELNVCRLWRLARLGLVSIE